MQFIKRCYGTECTIQHSLITSLKYNILLFILKDVIVNEKKAAKTYWYDFPLKEFILILFGGMLLRFSCNGFRFCATRLSASSRSWNFFRRSRSRRIPGRSAATRRRWALILASKFLIYLKILRWYFWISSKVFFSSIGLSNGIGSSILGIVFMYLWTRKKTVCFKGFQNVD